MKKEDLVALMEQPPLPASAGSNRLVERINAQHKLIRYLLESLALQGKSILDMREKMIEHKSAIEGIGDLVTGEESEEPKIILPHQNLIGFDA
jgi:prefoldin subunit 5